MPKMKTNSAAAKRFRRTKNGIKRGHSNTSHIKTCKSQKRKRNLRKVGVVHSTDMDRVNRMLQG
jgi:large subunit ribosomal protein L35